jgi:ribosomal protein S18 acetylase RimI-like enzyme
VRPKIRPFEDGDLDPIVQLSLLAWEPVFTAWEEILGSELYPIAIYEDWRASQAEGVTQVCQDAKISTWVAEVDGQPVGFVSYQLDDDKQTGEVYMLAVHPAYQNDGIGTELNLFALDKFREAGMKLAVVGTGGDPGHAPARRSYEKAGYTGLPLMRYYQAL